jgi:hypothetical protein
MSGRKRSHPVLWSRRRTVLSALALAAVAAAMPRGGLRSAPISDSSSPLGLWRNRAAARAIGRRYLADHPDEADAGRLAHQLFGKDGAAPVTAADLRRAVDAARSRDFARSDTVVIDGWLLARSEARLCALALLS